VRAEALAGRGVMQSEAEWGARNRVLTETMSALVNRFASTRSSSGDARGIDVGCQTGALTDAMQRSTAFDWTGIDPRIAEPRLSPGGRRLLAGSADRLPFEDQSFQVALFANVYEHVLPGRRHASLTEIARVLVPGGVIVGQIPNPYFPVESHSRLPFMGWLPMRAQKAYWRFSPVPWEHDFFVVTMRQLRDSAEQLGYAALHVENFNYPLDVIPHALRPAARLFAAPMRHLPWAWQFVLQREG
jgi:SAM-dependent methyltransferase